MAETCGNYSATLVFTKDIVSCDIDIRPPFVPSEELLEFCGNESGVGLKHFVTTPNTTRLSAHILDEMVNDEVRDARFKDAAKFLVTLLHFVDEGEDVTYRDYELSP